LCLQQPATQRWSYLTGSTVRMGWEASVCTSRKTRAEHITLCCAPVVRLYSQCLVTAPRWSHCDIRSLYMCFFLHQCWTAANLAQFHGKESGRDRRCWCYRLCGKPRLGVLRSIPLMLLRRWSRNQTPSSGTCVLPAQCETGSLSIVLPFTPRGVPGVCVSQQLTCVEKWPLPNGPWLGSPSTDPCSNPLCFACSELKPEAVTGAREC